MNAVEQESHGVIAPVLNGAGLHARSRIGCIATSTSSARADLSTYLDDWDDGHFVTFLAEADIYVAFNNADAGAIDETATTAKGATIPWLLVSKVPQRMRIVKDYKWLIHKAGAATPKLRFYISSAIDHDSIL